MIDRTIVLVDEPTRMRDLLTSILRMRGYAVIEIDNGRELLKRLSHIRPDLLIIEAMLPGFSGFEACAILRRDPEFKNMPTLMMCSSAHKLPGDASHTKEYILSDEFLVRPFGLQDLLTRIEKLIGAVPSLKTS
jgi:twitching motility two-component system response regulator PilG